MPTLTFIVIYMRVVDRLRCLFALCIYIYVTVETDCKLGQKDDCIGSILELVAERQVVDIPVVAQIQQHCYSQYYG